MICIALHMFVSSKESYKYCTPCMGRSSNTVHGKHTSGIAVCSRYVSYNSHVHVHVHVVLTVECSHWRLWKSKEDSFRHVFQMSVQQRSSESNVEGEFAVFVGNMGYV